MQEGRKETRDAEQHDQEGMQDSGLYLLIGYYRGGEKVPLIFR